MCVSLRVWSLAERGLWRVCCCVRRILKSLRVWERNIKMGVSFEGQS